MDSKCLNVHKICRVCLLECREAYSIFTNNIVDDTSLLEVLTSIYEIQITTDNLPKKLCFDCTNEAINAFNFKKKCEKNEKILIQYFLLGENSDDHNEIQSLERVQTCIKEENPIDVGSSYVTHVNDFEIHEIPSADSSLYDERNTVENEESDQKKFFCDICSESFNSKDDRIAHLATHKKDSSRKSSENEGKEEETQENNTGKIQTFHCMECNAEFETKLRLKSHQVTHNFAKGPLRVNEPPPLVDTSTDEKDPYFQLCMPNGLKTIICKICQEHFKKVYKLKEHIRSHSEKKTFENIKITDKGILKYLKLARANNNKIVNTIIKRVNAENFDKLYLIATSSGLELTLTDSETESDGDGDSQHESSSHNKTYTCEICQKVFDRRYKIFHHQKTVHKNDKMPYLCEHCHFSCVSESMLKFHLRSQCANDLKTFSCPRCFMKFEWQENLVIHKTKEHTEDILSRRRRVLRQGKSFTCSECDKAFHRQEHLARHVKTHQPDEKKFECTICNRKFNRKDNMRSHMRTHRESREKEDAHKQLCVYCGRSFSNSSNLIVHMRRHTGEKPYKCDICDKGFPRSSDLQCHRRTHTGEKPCLCTICGKGFSRSNKLVRHMRIHTGVKPYKCTYCDRAFTQSNDLTLHIRRHTGDKPYVCGICGERFIQGTALQTHRRMRGHYEENNQQTLFSNNSVNNPNRMNFSNRGDTVENCKITPASQTIPTQPMEIKPVGRRNSRSIKQSSTNAGHSSVQSLSEQQTNKNVSNFPTTETTRNTMNFSYPTNTTPTNAMLSTSNIDLNNTNLSNNITFVTIGNGDLFPIENSVSNVEYHQTFQ